MKLKEIAQQTPYHLKLKPQVEHYLDVYEQYFHPLKDSPIRFLEIGIAEGGSLGIWHQYFTQAEIHGIDLHDSRIIKYPNTHMHVGNETDKNLIDQIVKDYGLFDVILDDGAHHTSAQITTFEYYKQYLKNNGIYIIEDLHTSYWSSFVDSPINTVEYMARKVHDLNSIHQTRDTFWNLSEYLATKANHTQEFKYIHFYDSIVVLGK